AEAVPPLEGAQPVQPRERDDRAQHRIARQPRRADAIERLLGPAEQRLARERAQERARGLHLAAAAHRLVTVERRLVAAALEETVGLRQVVAGTGRLQKQEDEQSRAADHGASRLERTSMAGRFML